MNSKEFYNTIEKIVKEKKITYMDAIIWYCDENEIDLSIIKPIVSKNLKSKISIEGK